MVFLIPSPWATSWNIVLPKKASKVMCLRWSSGAINSPTDRHEDLVELGAHRVLELQPAGAFLQLDLFVVGQVDRNRFGAGIAVARVIDHVVGVQIGVAARRFALVGVVHGQAALQLRKETRKLGQPFTPRQVLDQHVGLVGRAVPVELVLVGLDRANDDVDLVVLHVHPGQIAGLVAIGDEGVGAQVQIILKLRVVRVARRLAQKARGAFELQRVGHVVRNDSQAAFVVTADQRVEAVLAAQGGCVEFLFGHVRRIETRAGGLGVHAAQKRPVSGKPVPRPVVDVGKATHRRIVDGVEERRLLAVGLEPEQLVHDLGRVDQQRQHGLLVVRQVGQIGRQRELGVDVEALLGAVDKHCRWGRGILHFGFGRDRRCGRLCPPPQPLSQTSASGAIVKTRLRFMMDSRKKRNQIRSATLRVSKGAEQPSSNSHAARSPASAICCASSNLS